CPPLRESRSKCEKRSSHGHHKRFHSNQRVYHRLHTRWRKSHFPGRHTRIPSRSQVLPPHHSTETIPHSQPHRTLFWPRSLKHHFHRSRGAPPHFPGCHTYTQTNQTTCPLRHR